MSSFRSGIGLSYDDVLLIPKFGVVKSRKDVVLHHRIVGEWTGEVPIISAPMSSVTNGLMARAMWENQAFGIIHRFQTAEEQAKEFDTYLPSTVAGSYWHYAGAALGVNDYERFDRLHQVGCRIYCIDIAHAHHASVEKFLTELNALPSRKNFSLMVGNVATAEGAEFLAELNVDAIKVGIGPGSACTTREVTGFGVPQLTAVIETSEVAKEYDIPLVADGGIKSSGDIVKALAAGADSVMIGKLLASAEEAPAPGDYYGMASDRANYELSQKTKQDINIHREGVEGIVGVESPVEDIINTLVAGIRSGVSYAGARNLYELRENAEFIVVAPGVAQESATRI